ncbi:hypothetical protein GOBAR_AA08243 [Gossypium barbadense]|uniref:Uncharacterized protein n=1 Tax=Gossypium barbadense TaxID=3634 RepID=A0A2P5Y9Y0_GOSBA|nr:hypothetical protein GOBAR_AA08243 [Gossypium barbadense]
MGNSVSTETVRRKTENKPASESDAWGTQWASSTTRPPDLSNLERQDDGSAWIVSAQMRRRVAWIGGIAEPQRATIAVLTYDTLSAEIICRVITISHKRRALAKHISAPCRPSICILEKASINLWAIQNEGALVSIIEWVRKCSTCRLDIIQSFRLNESLPNLRLIPVSMLSVSSYDVRIQLLKTERNSRSAM